MNYLDVRLAAGEVWHYDPPADHDVAWFAIHEGRVRTPLTATAGELVVFEREHTAVTFEAETDCAFVLGSAASHPHDLVLGHHSVHTTSDALRAGESGIDRIGESLRKLGKL